jgi:hypothetical protein
MLTPTADPSRDRAGPPFADSGMTGKRLPSARGTGAAISPAHARPRPAVITRLPDGVVIGVRSHARAAPYRPPRSCAAGRAPRKSTQQAGDLLEFEDEQYVIVRQVIQAGVGCRSA